MDKRAAEIIAEALGTVFISPNVSDTNWEAANLVDVVNRQASATYRVAEAIRDLAAAVREHNKP